MPGSFLWFFSCSFSDGKGTVAGAVGMWESRQRFPRAGERRETRFWFSSFSTARHFHGASRFSCALALLAEAEEELALGFLHEPG